MYMYIHEQHTYTIIVCQQVFQNVYLQTRIPTRAGDIVFQVHLNVVYFVNITISYKSA